MNFRVKLFLVIFILIGLNTFIYSQAIPEILSNIKVAQENYLPDFSFAGYHNGEKDIPKTVGTIINAIDYGVIPNDGLDDSKALIKAIQEASKIEGSVTLQLPKGRLILSNILYLKRSHFVLRGAGSGENGTEIYCPRPLMYLEDPEGLKELREYLLEFDKRQVEKENNIDLAFSQYAWAGGFIWTKVPEVRVKSYLQKYEVPYDIVAKVSTGERGSFSFKVSEAKNLKIGDVLELQIFNKEGEKGEIIDDLYITKDVKIGSHHWSFPDLPLVRQQVMITNISKNKVTINAPLTININPSYEAQLVSWKHLEEVGIEHLKITFPKYPRVAHHVEPGFNAIYLTRVFNSWVNNVIVDNADSGIITEEIANVTINDITTKGENFAHYTVMMQGTYNVLAEGIKVYNRAVHPLSFNTFATKSVYLDCEVFTVPILDQHSGANHQNLFDNTKVHLTPNEDRRYPLFEGGGAGYWKPSHGAFSTFWNTEVNILGSLERRDKIILNGMNDGPYVRVIGVHGNNDFEIGYEPFAYIEFVNRPLINTPSLYRYQLKKRLKNQ